MAHKKGLGSSRNGRDSHGPAPRRQGLRRRGRHRRRDHRAPARLALPGRRRRRHGPGRHAVRRAPPASSRSRPAAAAASSRSSRPTRPRPAARRRRVAPVRASRRRPLLAIGRIVIGASRALPAPASPRVGRLGCPPTLASWVRPGHSDARDAVLGGMLHPPRSPTRSAPPIALDRDERRWRTGRRAGCRSRARDPPPIAGPTDARRVAGLAQLVHSSPPVGRRHRPAAGRADAHPPPALAAPPRSSSPTAPPRPRSGHDGPARDRGRHAELDPLGRLRRRADQDLVDVDVRRLGDRVHDRARDVLGLERAVAAPLSKNGVSTIPGSIERHADAGVVEVLRAAPRPSR